MCTGLKAVMSLMPAINLSGALSAASKRNRKALKTLFGNQAVFVRSRFRGGEGFIRPLHLFRTLLHVAAVITLATGLAYSSDRPIDKRDYYSRQPVTNSQGSLVDSIIDPELDWPVFTGVLQTDEINASFASNGTFGFGVAEDPPIGWPHSSFESPPGSGLDYLLAGALWVGGIVDEDTLVSHGFAGWTLGAEMFPPMRRRGSITPIASPGDYSLRALFYDTVTANVEDDYFGRPHIPLNLKIANRSHAWRQAPYENCVLYDVVVTNIGRQVIEAGYVGLLFDPDVRITPGYAGIDDDMTGSMREYGIAYGIDNDGDPVGGVYIDSVSPTRSFAFKLLHTSFEIRDTSFNWWVSNGNPAYDFGPRQVGTVEHPFRDFGTGGLGTPEGDASKYHIMSLPEWDYDQCYTDLMLNDPFDTVWIKPPAAMSDNVMQGGDIHFLMSIGPLDLEPDSSIRLTFTTFTADSMHTNPSAFVDYLPEWPYAYIAELGLQRLMDNAAVADEISDSLMNPYMAPVGFAVQYTSADSVTLEWDPWCFDGVDGYNLYLTEIDYSLFPYPGVIPPWLFPDEPSVVIDSDLPYRHVLRNYDPTKVYTARVAHRIGTEAGEKSLPLHIHGSPPPAAPQAQTFIVIQPGEPATICWSNPSGEAVDHYNFYKYDDSLATADTYLSFYSKSDSTGTEAPVDSFDVDGTTWYYFSQQPYDQVSGSDTCFSDITEDGNVYVVTAVDSNGFESEMTAATSVWIVPEASRGILLVTNSNLLAAGFTPHDSVSDFYNEVLSGYDYEIFSVADSCPTSPQCRPNLHDLATFGLTIIDDGFFDNLPDLDREAATGAITKYLLAGGSVAYFGSFSSYLNFSTITDPRYRLIDDPFVNSFFGIDSVFYVGAGYFLINGLEKVDTLFGFHCAEAIDPYYSDLWCDTTRYPMGPGWEHFWPTNTPPTVSAFFPSERGQVTHVYRSLSPASSMVEGDPVGIKTSDGQWTTYLFGFHLYFMQPQQARELVTAIVSSTTDVEDSSTLLPGAYHLRQNYPNPFNPATTIEFSVPCAGDVRLTVFNILGQEIVRLVDKAMAPGNYEVSWDGKDTRNKQVASGVYLYRLQTENFSETRKMLLVK